MRRTPTCALARFACIQPFLEEGVPLTHLAAQHAGSLCTLQRWVARYKKAGLGGLIQSIRTDHGTHHTITSELHTLIEGLALQNPVPSIAAIHPRIAALAPQNGWTAISYSTVERIINNLDPALKALAHDGTESYRTHFDLLYRREATTSNEL